MSFHEYWENLINDTKKGIEIAKKDKKQKQLLIDSLDRIFDEIKSGEYNTIAIEQNPLQIYAKSLFLTFKSILNNFDDWSFKQTIAFALIHIFFTFKKENLIPLLNEEQDNEGPSTSLLNLLIHNITDSKREVRDATAQVLGGLSKIIGAKEVLKMEKISDILMNPKKYAHEEGYKAIEGLMNALGYILRNCGNDVNLMDDNLFNEYLNILIENANDLNRFESYSSYIRRYAIRSLAKSLEYNIERNVNIKKVKEEVMLKRLEDIDIDVRKANANLYLNYIRKQENLDLNELFNLLKEENLHWQKRHGICLVFEAISHHFNLITKLDKNMLNQLFNELKQQILYIHSNKLEKSASNGNAIAGKALINFFIKINNRLDELKLENTNDLLFTFKNVKELVVVMLKSDDPLLLDAGNYCVIQCITKLNTNKEDQEILKDFYDLLSLTYKNTFHASYPIKQGASISLNRFIEYNKLRNIEELISNLTFNIIEILKEESKSKNYEVRESVYKAFEDLFIKTKNNELLNNNNALKDIFNCLLFGIKDLGCGSNSDYPRSAAILSLASYFIYLSKSKDNLLLKELLQTTIDLISKKLLKEEDELTITNSTIKLVRVLDIYYKQFIQEQGFNINELKLQLFILSNVNDEELKYAALPVRTSLIGSLKKKGTVVALLNEMKSNLFDSEIDEEKREAVSQVFRYFANPKYFKDVNTEEVKVDVLMKVIAKALLLEDNRESNVIQVNTLLFLKAILLGNDSIRVQMMKNSFMKFIMLYLLYLLANTKDFEMNEELLEDASEDDDEENSDEEEEDEEELKYPKASSTKLNVNRSSLVISILLQLLPNANDVKGLDLEQYVEALVSILSKFNEIETNQPNITFYARELSKVVKNDLSSLQKNTTLIEKEQEMKEKTDKNKLLKNLLEDDELLDGMKLLDHEDDNENVNVYYPMNTLDGYHYYIPNQKVEDVTSIYYKSNVICSALLNNGEEAKVIIESLIKKTQELIEEEDDSEKIVKLCQLLYVYLNNEKKNLEEIQSVLLDFANTTLLEKVKENEGEELHLIWYWRLLEVILRSLPTTTTDEEEEDNLSKEVLTLLLKDEFRNELKNTNSILYIAGCMCALQGNLSNNEMKLIVSDLIADEDIDEGKLNVQFVLHDNEITLPLPTPKVESVKANETFAPTQSI